MSLMPASKFINSKMIIAIVLNKWFALKMHNEVMKTITQGKGIVINTNKIVNSNRFSSNFEQSIDNPNQSIL